MDRITHVMLFPAEQARTDRADSERREGPGPGRLGEKRGTRTGPTRKEERDPDRAGGRGPDGGGPRGRRASVRVRFESLLSSRVLLNYPSLPVYPSYSVRPSELFRPSIRVIPSA